MNIEYGSLLNMVKTASGREHLEADLGLYCRSIIRENSWWDKLVSPKPINPSDCRPSMQGRFLTTFVQLEPGSTAFVLGVGEGAPTQQYITTSMAEIPFLRVQSPPFTTAEDELMWYQFSVTKVIEENVVRDIHEARDGYAAGLCYASTNRTGNVQQYNGLFDKAALRLGFDMLTVNALRAATVVMPETMWNQLNTQGNEFFGSQLNAQVTTSGYVAETLSGRKVITTTKLNQFTRNPYRPRDAYAIGFAPSPPTPGGAKAMIPFDPAYAIGSNLSGQNVGGVAGVTYPVVDVLNGYFNGTGGTTDTMPQTRTLWAGNTALFFTDENFIGKNWMLRDLQFWIKQESGKLSFDANMLWGTGIVNVNSVSQVTLVPVL